MKSKYYLDQTKIYHDKKYRQKGLNFQRKHPNEDVIRFENKFLKKKSLILDIGCGTGRNLIYLIKKNHFVHGIDFSSEALNLLNKLLLKEKIKKYQYKLILDSIISLEKIEIKYDAVIDCLTSYSLIKKDFEKYIDNVSKKLNYNGHFHLQTLSKKADIFKKSYPAKIYNQNSIKKILRKNAPFYGDEYLFTFYSRKEIKKILKRKFKKVNIETHSRTYRNSKEFFEYFVINCKK